MQAAVRRFVVLSTPRTGSNWLCSLLNSHPAILCHHEIFNPDGIHYALSARGGELDFGSVCDRDRNPVAVLERVWSHSLGYQLVGFKINRGQSPDALRAVLEDSGVAKLLLRRDNRIRTFVSERLAQMTGEWESYKGCTVSTEPPRVAVDRDELQRHVDTNARYYARIRRSLDASDQTYLDLRYEDLQQAESLRTVLEWLQVAADLPLQAGTRKQNTLALRQLVANYEELRLQLRGSELESDLN